MDKAAELREMAICNSHKLFVLMLSVENIKSYFADLTNVRVVHIGGDWLNQIADYQNLKPVTSKSVNCGYISLNRGARMHRVISASYQFGNKWDKLGNITFMSKPSFFPSSTDHILLDFCPWEFSAVTPIQRSTILVGYELMVAIRSGRREEDYQIYETIGENNNIANFNTNLRQMYEHSIVEVVSETSFADPAFLLTEKTMHCFAAFNFPIILSSCGTVQFLRDIGFDMFDDIVTHSYDMEPDPVKRIVMALDNNIALLQNRDLAKQKWQECLPRFEKNWEFISSGKLAQWYEARTRKEFSAALVG
jgi:hypothetical protein